ncbi:uncharacterized protein LOC111029863, partial [Myzus persicae]|uniref:uncharacterized protein LOC111029863 n=1 Tax=Myzus persicae TaxID=13164 RepID=UPI000B932EA6
MCCRRDNIVECRFFIVQEKDRATLLPIIKREIEPETTIFSEEWKAYSCLNDHGYIHNTVNHKNNCIDPQTGAETQTMECYWRHIKVKYDFVAFNEYVLLILYIKWMVYVINEQILERRSCLSTFRDMYLEVIECLHQVNRSIFGLPAIVDFIAGNVAGIIIKIYGFILFRRDFINDPYLVFSIIDILTKTVNILILYTIGDITEKEINRMSDVLHRRSVIERNPRIKRQ